jgi:hypothetical protein
MLVSLYCVLLCGMAPAVGCGGCNQRMIMQHLCCNAMTRHYIALPV